MTTRAPTAEAIPHPLAGKRMTGAEIIIQVLVDEGVQTLFGYSGGAILPTYDAVFRYNDEHRDANGTPPLPLFGGGMQVAPGALPTDGAPDLTLWQGFGLHDFVLQRRSFYDVTHVRLPGTRTGRLTRLRAESDERVAVDLDGEALGRLPLEIEVLPAALTLLS